VEHGMLPEKQLAGFLVMIGAEQLMPQLGLLVKA